MLHEDDSGNTKARFDANIKTTIAVEQAWVISISGEALFEKIILLKTWLAYSLAT